jgi:hypothetical protein
MDKYCRICWNTCNWRTPSGDARYLEIGDSYVADHGFGHEEWLFNFEWLLSGYNPDDPKSYRYGFLQPISKYRSYYAGKTFSILLYTVDPTKVTRAVACIKNVYVPNWNELEWAFKCTHDNGWLDMMRQHLRDLNIPIMPLSSPPPSTLANIRFQPENVIFYNPTIIFRPLTKLHGLTAINLLTGMMNSSRERHHPEQS